MDSSGTVSVADAENSAIRKITAAGEVTTFAGGSWGSVDGTGTAAKFNYPNGVALDSSRNVYVADSSNHTIRKITPAGVVTTLAGLARTSGSADGTGSAARFNFPEALCVDRLGNVFVADSNNQVMRKVTPSGVASSFARLAGNWGSDDGNGSNMLFFLLQGPAANLSMVMSSVLAEVETTLRLQYRVVIRR